MPGHERISMDHLYGGSQDPAPLLTADEREAVQQAGRLYTFIGTHVVADGPTRDGDLAELRAAVHLIQRAVLAQAAARACPEEFRLLGEVVMTGSPQEPLTGQETRHDENRP